MSTVEQRIDGAKANGLFIPDVMLSCQLVPAAAETPELRLQAALIYDLVHLASCWARKDHPDKLRRQIEYDHAWVNLTDESPYSFVACIESLGGNAEIWRKRLNEVYAGRLTLPKMHKLGRGIARAPQLKRPR